MINSLFKKLFCKHEYDTIKTITLKMIGDHEQKASALKCKKCNKQKIEVYY